MQVVPWFLGSAEVTGLGRNCYTALIWDMADHRRESASFILSGFMSDNLTSRSPRLSE